MYNQAIAARPRAYSNSPAQSYRPVSSTYRPRPSPIQPFYPNFNPNQLNPNQFNPNQFNPQRLFTQDRLKRRVEGSLPPQGSPGRERFLSTRPMGQYPPYQQFIPPTGSRTLYPPPQAIATSARPQKIRVSDGENQIDINLNISIDRGGRVSASHVQARPSINGEKPALDPLITSRLSQSYQSLFAEANMAVEEQKVFCVICNESYFACDKQRHLTLHRNRVQCVEPGNPNLHRGIHHLADQHRVISRPIVEPEEYNVQYTPNQHIIERNVHYKSRVRERPIPPTMVDSQVQVNYQRPDRIRPSSHHSDNDVNHSSTYLAGNVGTNHSHTPEPTYITNHGEEKHSSKYMGNRETQNTSPTYVPRNKANQGHESHGNQMGNHDSMGNFDSHNHNQPTHNETYGQPLYEQTYSPNHNHNSFDAANSGGPFNMPPNIGPQMNHSQPFNQQQQPYQQQNSRYSRSVDSRQPSIHVHQPGQMRNDQNLFSQQNTFISDTTFPDNYNSQQNSNNNNMRQSNQTNHSQRLQQNNVRFQSIPQQHNEDDHSSQRPSFPAGERGFQNTSSNVHIESQCQSEGIDTNILKSRLKRNFKQGDDDNSNRSSRLTSQPQLIHPSPNYQSGKSQRQSRHSGNPIIPNSGIRQPSQPSRLATQPIMNRFENNHQQSATHIPNNDHFQPHFQTNNFNQGNSQNRLTEGSRVSNGPVPYEYEKMRASQYDQQHPYNQQNNLIESNSFNNRPPSNHREPQFQRPEERSSKVQNPGLTDNRGTVYSQVESNPFQRRQDPLGILESNQSSIRPTSSVMMSNRKKKIARGNLLSWV